MCSILFTAQRSDWREVGTKYRIAFLNETDRKVHCDMIPSITEQILYWEQDTALGAVRPVRKCCLYRPGCLTSLGHLSNGDNNFVTWLWRRRGQYAKSLTRCSAHRGSCTWSSANDQRCDSISDKGNGGPRPQRAHHLPFHVRAEPCHASFLQTGNVASDPFSTLRF